MKKPVFLLLMVFAGSAFSSCGYRFGRGEVIERYCSICIPYVEGDERGVFTSQLIRAMSTQGALAYTSSGADLLLKVCLSPPSTINVGFAYAPQSTEEAKVVVSNEARIRLTATISLIDRCQGTCVLGPLTLSSWIDYDYEPDLSNVNDHAFSLGQLEMHNLAQDAAFIPLYAGLAEKIVDYVNHSW